jgi:hypothetical protein
MDHAALIALVDRWRPETRTFTFHDPCGEMTITLEDVAMLFGLHIWASCYWHYLPGWMEGQGGSLG